MSRARAVAPRERRRAARRRCCPRGVARISQRASGGPSCARLSNRAGGGDAAGAGDSRVFRDGRRSCEASSRRGPVAAPRRARRVVWEPGGPGDAGVTERDDGARGFVGRSLALHGARDVLRLRHPHVRAGPHVCGGGSRTPTTSSWRSRRTATSSASATCRTTSRTWTGARNGSGPKSSPRASFYLVQTPAPGAHLHLQVAPESDAAPPAEADLEDLLRRDPWGRQLTREADRAEVLRRRSVQAYPRRERALPRRVVPPCRASRRPSPRKQFSETSSARSWDGPAQRLGRPRAGPAADAALGPRTSESPLDGSGRSKARRTMPSRPALHRLAGRRPRDPAPLPQGGRSSSRPPAPSAAAPASARSAST